LDKHVPVTSTSFILALGTKNSKALIAEKFFVSSLSFEVKRSFWRIFSPGIGADLFYDSSTKRKFIAGDKVNEYKSIHDFRTGLHLSQSIVYNQFSVTLQEGVYVLVKDTVFKNHMYNRLIVRQKVNQHLFFQLAFKSHGAVLDYIEFGIGYSGKS
jgi:hypothetical protein